MDIKSLLKEKTYHLIDVRQEMELDADNSIPGAINIPLNELEDRKQEIINLEGNKIFFCRSGNRSGQAVEYFTSEGMIDVYNGGSWEAVKKALEN